MTAVSLVCSGITRQGSILRQAAPTAAEGLGSWMNWSGKFGSANGLFVYLLANLMPGSLIDSKQNRV